MAGGGGGGGGGEGGTVRGAANGPRGTDISAVDSPGGPLLGGDQFLCLETILFTKIGEKATDFHP